MPKVKPKVDVKPKLTPRFVAYKLLKLFGKDGEHWMEGALSDGEGNYCLLGALDELHICSKGKPIVMNAIKKEHGYVYDDIPDFNDSSNWETVKALLCKMAFPKGKSDVKAKAKR